MEQLSPFPDYDPIHKGLIKLSSLPLEDEDWHSLVLDEGYENNSFLQKFRCSIFILMIHILISSTELELFQVSSALQEIPSTIEK